MKFLFITREGRKDPGARIRCWGFSEKLKKKGLNSSVFSFVDRLGAKSGKDEVKFTFREKLKYSYKGFRIFSKEAKNSVFIINRFNYHTIPAWIVSKIKRVPIIFDMDDWEAREDIGSHFKLLPKSKAEYLVRLFAKGSSFCVAASLYLKEYLSQFNRNVYYIPTGIDTDKFRMSPRREEVNFIFSWHGSVNRIESLRYIEFIIECFLVIYKKYNFTKLFITGDGIFSAELIKLIKKNSCDSIVYNNFIEPDNISAYLDKIDVGLVPLLDKTRFNLSKSPVKLFEYMAKAKSTIVSPVGEASHIIKDGINGFLASNRSEFIFNMEQLIKNPDLARNMGITARKTVEENYSLDILGERFAGILKNDFNNSFNL